MDKFIKTNVVLFVLLSILSIVFLLFKNTEKSVTFAIIILISNLSLMLLFILVFNNLIKVPKKFFFNFIFWMVISTFVYWYVFSTLLYYIYESFISLNGLFYFIVTRSTIEKILLVIGLVFAILFSSLSLAYLTKDKVDKIIEKEIKEKIKQLSKISVKSKSRNRWFWISLALCIIIIIGTIFIIPDKYSHEINPFVDFLNSFHFGFGKNYTYNNQSPPVMPQSDKLFNVTLSKDTPVIIIMLESVPRDKVTYYGYERNITPNIDEFAMDSVVFNNSFSIASHSDYAQPSFLSARYTLIGKYRNFFSSDYNRSFPWDSLKKENYSTAYISSQNDEWANIIDYFNFENLDLYTHSITDEIYDYGGGNAKKDYDEITINKTINWLNNVSGPFFLYVNLQATHYPYTYPENNSFFQPDNVSGSTTYFKIPEEEYNNSVNRYDNSLLYVDKQVGVLLEYLKKTGLYNKSIIVLTADHGETLEYTHDYIRHGFGVYREEILVPMFIKIPGQEHPTINKNVRHIDVIPTILDVLNLEIPKSMQGEPMGGEKDIFMFTQNQKFKIGMIKDNIKMILDMDKYTIETYNLTSDPYETINLQDEENLEFKEYRDRLLDWYNCQKLYYSEEEWKNGIEIECD